MFANLKPQSTPSITWEERLLKSGGKSKNALKPEYQEIQLSVVKPEYQELKFTLHRKLVDQISLEALTVIDNQRARNEVRRTLIDSD